MDRKPANQSWNGTEKRQARRYSLPRRITFEVSAQQTSHAPSRIGAQILNVSQEGICLLTKKALKTAQIVKIDLPLPIARTTVATIAEVQWVSKGSGNSAHQAGLRFLL